MSNFFFIPGWGIICLFIFNMFIFLSGNLFVIFITLTLSLMFLFFLRKGAISFHNTLRNDGEIFLAPVFGFVKSIRSFSPAEGLVSAYHEIRIVVSFWDQKGLYLPIYGEVLSMKEFEGRKFYRYSSKDIPNKDWELFSRTEMSLSSQNNKNILLKFIDCFWGRVPELRPRTGDRGRAGACFGFYPLGGTVIIQLPIKSDILVFENEKVIPGQTVIGFIKN